jgi:hypothetical protein
MSRGQLIILRERRIRQMLANGETHPFIKTHASDDVQNNNARSTSSGICKKYKFIFQCFTTQIQLPTLLSKTSQIGVYAKKAPTHMLHNILDKLLLERFVKKEVIFVFTNQNYRRMVPLNKSNTAWQQLFAGVLTLCNAQMLLFN